MRKIKRRKKKYPIFEKPKHDHQQVWVSKDKYVSIAYSPKGLFISVIGTLRSESFSIRPVSYNSAFVTFENTDKAYWEYEEQNIPK